MAFSCSIVDNTAESGVTLECQDSFITADDELYIVDAREKSVAINPATFESVEIKDLETPFKLVDLNLSIEVLNNGTL